MSKTVHVLLLEDIANLGEAGAIVETSEGYARNFLFPQGKAALANTAVITKARQDDENRTKTAQADLAALQQKAVSLSGTELLFMEKVKDGDQIFGKVTAARIVKELNKQANLVLKVKDIQLPEPITKLGTYDVTASLSKDVETSLKVTVEAEPAETTFSGQE